MFREGGVFAKSSDKELYDSSSVPVLFILRIQRSILLFKYINSTHFIPNHITINMQTYLAKLMENICQFQEYDVSWSLIESEAYLKFWFRREGLIGEEDLIETWS